MKKVLSILLLIVIILTTLPIIALAQEEQINTIIPDTPIDVELSWTKYTELYFTPNETAQYYISSKDSNDIFCSIIDSDGNDISAEVYTYDGGFKEKAFLSAGETYIIKLECGQNLISGIVTVVLTKSKVTAVEFNDITLIDGKDSYKCAEYNEVTGEYDLVWTAYNYNVTGKVTLDDGSTQSFDGWAEIGDERDTASLIDGQTYGSEWVAGNTYTVKGKIFGLSDTFNVTILHNPIKSLEVSDCTTYEKINSGKVIEWVYDEETQTQKEVEYLKYTYSTDITITYRDGTTEKISDCSSDGAYVNVLGSNVWISFNDGQSYSNVWDEGRHTVTTELYGVEANFTVEVVKCPVATITAKHESITKNTNGSFTGDPQYYKYDLDSYNRTEYTVTYKSGEIVTSSGCEIYDKFGVWPEITTNQAYDNQWDVGINVFEVSLGTVKGIGTVEILADPYNVTSISARAITPIYEGTHCSNIWSENGEYNVYDSFHDIFEYTINYGDGNVYVGRYPYTIFNVDPTVTTDQSYQNQWGVGTHTVTIDFMGLNCEADVEIIEFNVESITAIANKDLIENYEGYSTWENDKEYFKYETYDLFTYTVIYNNGETFIGNQNDISCKFGACIDDFNCQSYDNQWKLGENTYKFTFMGVNGECKVNVVKNPIESISAKAKKDIMEDIDCYVWNDENGETENYYNLDYAFDYTVTYDGGKIFTGNRDDLYIKFGEWSTVQVSQLELGKNTVEIEFMDVKGTADVNLVECEYKALEISGKNELIITLTKNDGSKVSGKVINFNETEGGLGGCTGAIETTIGTFYNATFSYKVVEIEDDAFSIENKELQLTLGKLRSNKIDCDYLKAFHTCESIYNKTSDKYIETGNHFSFNGITYSSLEDLASIACYTNGSIWSGDYYGDYYLLDAEIVNESIKEVFGITADVKTSTGYDEQTGKFKLSDKHYKYYPFNGKIEFKDGYWEFKQNITEDASIIIRLNEDFTVKIINMCDKVIHATSEIFRENATCTTDGLILSECDLCGEIIEEAIPSKGHNYKVEITEATDTEDGKKIYTCENCGYSYTELIPMTGRHNFEVIKQKDATCICIGYTVYKCSVCGETKIEKTDILPHDHKIYSKIEPTYTKAGQNIFKCKDCSTQKTEIIYALCDFDKNGFITSSDYALFDTSTVDASVFDFDKNGVVDDFDSIIVKNLTNNNDLQKIIDINADGESDIRDLVRAKKIIAGSMPANTSNTNADINLDSETNAEDILFIRKFILMVDFKIYDI